MADEPTPDAPERAPEEARVDTAELERLIEALLFLSSDPVGPEQLVDATDADAASVAAALRALGEDLEDPPPRHRPARAGRRLRARLQPARRGRRPPPLRQAAHAAADARAGRDARRRRLPAAGLAAGDRPHPRRQRRVGGGDADRARRDRGGRPLAVRRRPATARPTSSCACSASDRSTTCPTSPPGTRRPRSPPTSATACCAPARRASASRPPRSRPRAAPSAPGAPKLPCPPATRSAPSAPTSRWRTTSRPTSRPAPT